MVAQIITLPEPVEQTYQHLDLKADGTWLLLNDIHIPYHDLVTLNLSIDRGVKEQVKGILLNGDIADFHAISQFDKLADEPRYKDEIVAVRRFLQYLRHRFPKARIVFKEGNHEERLYSYLYRKCQELWELEELTIPSLLHFDRYGIEHVGKRQVMMMGKLHVLHGHEYRYAISNPVNPARGLFLKAKAVSLCGHFHQTSEHTEPTIAWKQIACWSVGCACGLRPYYSPLNKWNNGFAMIDVERDGTFAVRNYRILNGKIV